MVTIYAPDATDFSTLGLGALAPYECVIGEQAGGMYTLALTHPMDTAGKWLYIAPGCIVKAPAPVREDAAHRGGRGGGDAAHIPRQQLRAAQPAAGCVHGQHAAGRVRRGHGGRRTLRGGQLGARHRLQIRRHGLHAHRLPHLRARRGGRRPRRGARCLPGAVARAAVPHHIRGAGRRRAGGARLCPAHLLRPARQPGEGHLCAGKYRGGDGSGGAV